MFVPKIAYNNKCCAGIDRLAVTGAAFQYNVLTASRMVAVQ